MPYRIGSPDDIKKVASIIKSRSQQAGHAINLSASREIAARLYGYLGWNHLLKRYQSETAEPPRWDILRSVFRDTLAREGIPRSAVEDILTALGRHFGGEARETPPPPPGAQDLLERLRALHDADEIEALIDAVLRIPAAIYRTFPPAFFSMLDDIVRRYPPTALALVHVVPEPSGSEAAARSEIARLRIALAQPGGDDPHLHLAAAMLLSRTPEAAEHLERALSSGTPDAPYVAGSVHEIGMGGVPDLDRAMEFYLEGMERHDDSKCVLAVAKLLMTKNDLDPLRYGYDPEELLEAICEEDSEEGRQAAEMLDMLKEARTLPTKLPYVVVPVGSKRPKLVRDALKSHLRLSNDQAEAATAAMLGFDGWHRMLNAANDQRTVKGPFDEQCDAPTFIERRRLLTNVLRMHVNLDEYMSEIAVELLKPTARDGRPSLRKLDEIAQTRLFPVSSRELREGMEDFMERNGFGGTYGSYGNLVSALRSMNPIDPEVWCEYLERECGWDIRQVRPPPTESGAKVAVAKGAGRSFDVYMVSAAYEPGDRTDLLVDGAMKDIDRKGADAMILFSKALVRDGEASDLGLLYGGRIRLDGNWSDFTVRPGGGVAEAVEQAGLFQYPPREEFTSRFGFKGHREAGAHIAANSEPGPDGEYSFGLIRMSTGWMSFLRA